jgi:hypothetical protein
VAEGRRCGKEACEEEVEVDSVIERVGMGELKWGCGEKGWIGKGRG